MSGSRTLREEGIGGREVVGSATKTKQSVYTIINHNLNQKAPVWLISSSKGLKDNILSHHHLVAFYLLFLNVFLLSSASSN